MQIDLKWAMPAVMPISIVMMCRVVWWVSGAEWTQGASTVVALIASVVGVFLGFFTAETMDRKGIKWIVGEKK